MTSILLSIFNNFTIFRGITLGRSNSSRFKIIGQHLPSCSYKAELSSAGKTVHYQSVQYSIQFKATYRSIQVRQLMQQLVRSLTNQSVQTSLQLYSLLNTISNLLSESYHFISTRYVSSHGSYLPQTQASRIGSTLLDSSSHNTC